MRTPVLLALVGVMSPSVSVWGLPPCGAPGTITTVTAPTGDYLAAFGDYKSYLPFGLALDPSGHLYVADASLIYHLEADGTATRLVGVPQTRRERRDNVLQDSVAALDARIAPGAMAFDQQGRLYFVDHVNWAWSDGGKRSLSRVARLEANGLVVTFAGTGEYGSSRDGGPATEAQLGYIGSLVFDREGNLLIAGTGGIRRIDRQGMISTLVEADQVTALVMDEQGRLYFTLNNQVFRRSAEGVIDIVAGSGVDPNSLVVKSDRYYFGTEGRPATEAPFHFPADLVIDKQGALYIANFNFHRIHRVRSDGIIETIAGNGLDYGSSRGCAAVEKRVAAGKQWSGHRCRDHIGDGGSALEAPIWWPFRLLLTPQGDLLVSMLNSFRGLYWGGEEFSQLRRICGVSERMMPTAVEAVETSASRAEETFPQLHLYPNPFNAAVTVAFRLAHSASVGVRIYNELGQQVRVLVAEEVRPAGSYQFVWDGRDQAGHFQASGTYLLVLSVDGAIETHKLTLLH